MLAWAEERHRPTPGPPTLADDRRARDATPTFAATSRPRLRADRRLADALSPPVAGRTAPGTDASRRVYHRAVREEELEERVAIHREVWHPSRVTVDGYQAIRAIPGYDPELDIVAVAPDGTIAAYCICWHDEVNRHGLFEPVGAREAYRGRGLAKAVLLETMRRLRDRGCEHAYVLTFEDRLPACRLYLAAGFEIIDRWVGVSPDVRRKTESGRHVEGDWEAVRLIGANYSVNQRRSGFAGAEDPELTQISRLKTGWSRRAGRPSLLMDVDEMIGYSPGHLR